MFLKQLRRTATRRIPVFLSIIVVGAAQLSTAGNRVPSPPPDPLDNTPDRQAAESADFIVTLALTPRQARMTLPYCEKACRLHMDNYRDRAELQPLQLDAYTAFLEQIRLNQGLDTEVQRRAAGINQRAKQLREELITNLNALAKQICQDLTPRQRQLAERYAPKKRTGPARLGGFPDRPKRSRQTSRGGQRWSADLQRFTLGDEELAEARKELNAIKKAAHPLLTGLAKHLLTPAAAESLYRLAHVQPPHPVREAIVRWRSGTRDYPLIRCRQDQQTIRGLRGEITNWNLANGLDFTSRQIERILQLADQAERLKAARPNTKPEHGSSPSDFNAELVRLETEAESVLHSDQLQALKNYRPCLIPRQNLTDPVRVGQANRSNWADRWLHRARRTPDKRLQRMIDRRVQSETARWGFVDHNARDRRRNRLHQTVRSAARMSNIDFALSKNELAEAIHPRYRENELVATVNGWRRERGQPGRTCRFLLNGGLAAVLRARYEQLSGESPVLRHTSPDAVGQTEPRP